jgi:beta-N-acetylglucosaminidase
MVMIVYIMAVTVFSVPVLAETARKAVVARTSALNVRVDADKDAATVRVAGKLQVLSPGDEVYIIGEKEGPGTKSNLWYQIQYVNKDGNTVNGFSNSYYFDIIEENVEITVTPGVTVVNSGTGSTGNSNEGTGTGDDTGNTGNTGNTGDTGTTTTPDPEPSTNNDTDQPNTSYEQELAAFPESYQVIIEKLHKTYPNWHFKAYNTGLEWEDAVDAESEIGHSLVDKSANEAYINKDDVDSNGKQIIRDGNNWVTASRFAVEYYMDPRNFMTERTILAFENLTYQGDDKYTVSGIQNILNKTFMKGSYTYTENGKEITKTYADTFFEAGKASKVNPYHLAAKCRIEQGTNGNYIGNGNYPGYEGYYNFFNIGAYAHDGRGANWNGAIYAKGGEDGTQTSYGRPWDNQYKAIMGGSQVVGEAYINKGQNTLYFERFNVVDKSRLYRHEYSTSVTGASSSASSMKAAYPADTFSGSLTFIIPVFKNMPADPVPKPENRTDEPLPVGNEPSTGSTGGVVSTSYTTNNGVLSGVSEGTTVETLKTSFTLSEGQTVKVYDKDGKEKTSGTISTSDVVRVMNGTEQVSSFNVSTLGDVSGDGKITIADLVGVRKHLLGLETLSGEYFVSADNNKDGKITIADLVGVRKHLLALAKLV